MRDELKGKNASLPINMTIYLDILLPLRQLSLSMQTENHDPVKHLPKVQEFTRTMTKLKSYVDDSDDNERIVNQDIALGDMVGLQSSCPEIMVQP